MVQAGRTGMYRTSSPKASKKDKADKPAILPIRASVALVANSGDTDQGDKVSESDIREQIAARVQSGKPYSPAEVAAMFHVSAKTVTRWAKAGNLHAVETVGGHRRFRPADVLALLDRLGW